MNGYSRDSRFQESSFLSRTREVIRGSFVFFYCSCNSKFIKLISFWRNKYVLVVF